MKNFIAIDFETRSEVPISRGVRNYVRGRHFTPLMMAYRIDEDGKTKLWLPAEQPAPPDEVLDAIRTKPVMAYNVEFDRHVWNTYAEANSLPTIDIRRTYDVQVQALQTGLPASLGLASMVVSDNQIGKDPAGGALIKLFSIPKKDGTFNKPEDYPSEWSDFQFYCLQDTDVMLWLHKQLPPISAVELKLFHLYSKINNRGLHIDVPLCRKAAELVEVKKARNIAEFKQLQNTPETFNPTQVAKFLEFLKERGVVLPNLTAAVVRDALPKAPRPEVWRMLEIRLTAGQTSATKFLKMAERADESGYITGFLRHHGAFTGRTSSVGLNMLNMPRPVLSPSDVDMSCRLINEGCELGVLEMLFGDALDIAKSCVRGAVMAPDGSLMVESDWSGIENRVGMWTGNEQEALEGYRRGVDEYVQFAASDLYHIAPRDVTVGQRQIAKSGRLGCLFGLGAGTTPDKGLRGYAKAMGVSLSAKQAKQVVKAYRAKHINLVGAWYAFGDAAIACVRAPCGASVPVTRYLTGKAGARFFTSSKYTDILFLMLPSGRALQYYRPKVERQETPWGKMQDVVTVETFDTYTRQWGRHPIIGPKFFHNFVQALSRDLLREKMLALDAVGLDIRMTAYDAVTLYAGQYEARDVAAEMQRIMVLPSQIPGLDDLPLDSKAWIAKRYRK